jgi:hypothetical protein
MGLILYCIFFDTITSVYTIKLADFLFCWDPCRFSPLWIALCGYFYRGDVLLRRRFVSETLCYRRRSVTEMFCYGDVLYGDVLSRRRSVRRRFVCAPVNRFWKITQKLQQLISVLKNLTSNTNQMKNLIISIELLIIFEILSKGLKKC